MSVQNLKERAVILHLARFAQFIRPDAKLFLPIVMGRIDQIRHYLPL